MKTLSEKRVSDLLATAEIICKRLQPEAAFSVSAGHMVALCRIALAAKSFTTVRELTAHPEDMEDAKELFAVEEDWSRKLRDALREAGL